MPECAKMGFPTKESDMKAGKYANHKFNKQELNAQRIWRQADGQQSEIVNALKSCDFYMSREDMHKRLDRRLNTIKRIRNRAEGLFPDVAESFTIASMEIAT